MKVKLSRLLERTDNTKMENELLKLAGSLMKYELAFKDAKADTEDAYKFFNATRKMCAELILENYTFSRKYNKLVKHFNKISTRNEKLEKQNNNLREWKQWKWSKFIHWLKNRVKINVKKKGRIKKAA